MMGGAPRPASVFQDPLLPPSISQATIFDREQKPLKPYLSLTSSRYLVIQLLDPGHQNNLSHPTTKTLESFFSSTLRTSFLSSILLKVKVLKCLLGLKMRKYACHTVV